jgi:hypothetical protein
MKKTVLTFCLMALSGVALAQTPSASELRTMDEEIAEVTPKLPFKIGTDVSLLKMTRNQDVIYSEYRIEHAQGSAKVLSPEVKKSMKEAACKQLVPTLEKGFKIHYRYFFADKSQFDLKFDKNACR